MNYFKIDGRQYRAEVCATLTGYLATISAPSLFNVGWEEESHALRDTRPAARRALKRELERLATDRHGKRANWTIVRHRAMAAIHEPLHKFAGVNR